MGGCGSFALSPCCRPWDRAEGGVTEAVLDYSMRAAFLQRSRRRPRAWLAAGRAGPASLRPRRRPRAQPVGGGGRVGGWNWTSSLLL